MGIEPTWSAWESCSGNNPQQLTAIKTVGYMVLSVEASGYLLCLIVPKWTMSGPIRTPVPPPMVTDPPHLIRGTRYQHTTDHFPKTLPQYPANEEWFSVFENRFTGEKNI